MSEQDAKEAFKACMLACIIIVTAILVIGGIGAAILSFTHYSPSTAEYNDCMAWAFGEDWKQVDPKDCPGRWNDRHGDLFLIEGTDSIKETTKKIHSYWLLFGKDQDKSTDPNYISVIMYDFWGNPDGSTKAMPFIHYIRR